MKTRLTLLACTCILLFASFTDPEPSSLKIQINASGVLLNETNISYGWKLETVQSILGKTKNVNKGGKKANTIYMYDQLGIMLYEGPKHSKEHGHVKAMEVFFDLSNHGTYYTQNTYSGKITIEDLQVTKNLLLPTIKAKLPDWHSEKVGIDHWYKFYRNDVYIYFMYNDAEDTLCEISLGEQM